MRSRILAVLAMLLVAGTSHGWAQETTGAVTGASPTRRAWPFQASPSR